LTASAGISYNKFLAKLASDHRKPNGQFVITPKMGPAFVQDLPVGKFHGIGPATSAKMNGLGIFTGLDMRNQTLEFMTANFRKAGDYYYWISRGIDERPVRANRSRKSVGAENTFSQDLANSPGGGIAAADREGLASLRDHGHAGPDSDAQGEVFRFRVDHPQQVSRRH
jgi:DNA polymerase IV